MSLRSLGLSEDLQSYVVAHSTRPDPVLTELAEINAGLGNFVSLQIAPDQGAFMTLLVRLIGATDALEIGTFTGYSSICIARGLPDAGKLLCCDVSEEWTSIAQRFWKRAGVDKKTELRLGAALETLHALPQQPQFDFAFIDADKQAYPMYWEEVIPRMRSGGLVLADNVLQRGRIADPSVTDADVVAVRDFNDRVMADERVEAVLLPLADGVTVARVK